MERETFLSGYCRGLDQSRMVTVVTENGKLTEVDCDFPDCPYAPACPVARKISDLIK